MVSFIVPAYNASKTIERTINSILNQKNTKLEYEIIIINDGSTDETEKTLEKISSKNVKVYTKENGGLSDARNEGVKKSSGEYIIFVDSDDYVSEDLLNDIEQYINRKIELIKWNPIFVKENGEEIKKEPCFQFEEKSGIDGFNILYGKDKLLSCAWNYAIKRELVPEFPKGRYHEDFATMPLVILKAKTMVSIDKNEYYYVQTDESIMRDEKKQRKRLEDILFNYDELLKSINKLSIDKLTDENFKIFITNSLLAYLPELQNENKKYFIQELKKRKVLDNLKIRNLKQLIKKCLLKAKGL